MRIITKLLLLPLIFTITDTIDAESTSNVSPAKSTTEIAPAKTAAKQAPKASSQSTRESEKQDKEKSSEKEADGKEEKVDKKDKKKELPLLSTLWFDYSADFPESALLFGLYYQESSADKALKKLNDKQWKAEKIQMQNEQGEALFVLLTGKYKTRLEADAAKASLRAQTGVRSKLVKYPASK